MSENAPLNYAPPDIPKPLNWKRILLPSFLAAAPIILAFIGFSYGYSGMCLSVFALLAGYILSPAAAILAVINGIRYRRHPLAVTLSVTALLISIAALTYEVWRMKGAWD